MDEVADSDEDEAFRSPEPSPAFFERAPGLSWRRTASGVVVMAPGSSVACTLHGPLAELWEALDRPTVVDSHGSEIRHLVASGLVLEGERL